MKHSGSIFHRHTDLYYSYFIIQISYLETDDLALELADVEYTGLQNKGNSPLISCAEHWTLEEAIHWFTLVHIQCDVNEGVFIEETNERFIPSQLQLVHWQI